MASLHNNHMQYIRQSMQNVLQLCKATERDQRTGYAYRHAGSCRALTDTISLPWVQVIHNMARKSTIPSLALVAAPLALLVCMSLLATPATASKCLMQHCRTYAYCLTPMPWHLLLTCLLQQLLHTTSSLFLLTWQKKCT